MEIRDYPSRMNDPASRRYEAFSYLPPLGEAEVRKQLQYVAAQDYDCLVEHVEPARAGDTYWYMWKLPLFGVRDPDAIARAAEECHRDNPGHLVRISGIDKKHQTLGFSLVVYRGS